MNVTELKANIQDTMENSFTDVQLDLFIENAERSIYAVVDFPDLHKNATSKCTEQNQYLAKPEDYVSGRSLAYVDGAGAYHYLRFVDRTFIREAYPSPDTYSPPKVYSEYDTEYFLLGPTPDAEYDMVIAYNYMPESITTASTSWLGDKFPVVLFDRCLLEAGRFLKYTDEELQPYERRFSESLKSLRNITNGRMKTDVYRTGERRDRPI